ncbi:MAG TPA: SHOCT domain-containing protein, partial [Nevskiaceae bacterium]|nr:SHOCT domain-containing protein [Nevskiaceae bacterium]
FAPPRCELTGVAPVAAAPSPAVAAPAATSEPAPPLPTSELESKLQILKRAHEQKLITDAEYEAKRRALLDAF